MTTAGSCRCGHGRASHRKVRGKLRLPCQAFVRVLVGGFTSRDGSLVIQPRMANDICKCRDWHPGAAA